MRPRFLALLLAFFVATSARADAPYDDATSGDVFVGAGLDESLLPATPSGYRELRRDDARYTVPLHFVDDVDALEQHRIEAWTRIGNDLGVALPDAVFIRIGRKPEEMFALAPRGFPPPSYASGVAYPELSLVLLTLTTHDAADPTPDVARILTHELSHVALHRAAGGRPLPRWFSEGVAIHHSDENGLERIQVLWEGASQARLAPLNQLTSRFADGSPDVSLAYAQAADVVAFLLRRPHGSTKMRRMLEAIRDGKSFEEGLKLAFFFDLRDLERDWRKDLDERHSAYPLVLGGGGLWALVIVALGIGFLRKRRHNRATLHRWANEEAAVDSLEAELRRKLEAIEHAERQRSTGTDDAHDDTNGSGRTLH